MSEASSVQGNRLNVVVINDHGHVSGGAAQVAISSLNELARQGCAVTFFSAVAPLDTGIDTSLVRVINLGTSELVQNTSRSNAALTGLWNTHSARALKEVLQRLDPRDTVVHLHTWTKALSGSVVQAALRLGFPVVCTLHDYFSVCPNGGFYNYPEQSICRLVPMSLSCVRSNCDVRSYSHKVWRVGRQAIQIAFSGMPTRVSHFISVSEFSERILKPLLPSTAVIHRVRNPVAVTRRPGPDTSANTAFTFVGRLSPEKGADVFAQAARATGVEAVFVGDGSTQASLMAICPEAEFRGWQPARGVTEAMRASRAIVFPSRWYETQGLVVQEAAANGIPAIVSDACAAAEQIVDGVNGLHFRCGDAEDLATKLRRLNDDPKLAAEMGRRAHAMYWEDPVTMDRHVEQLIACYRKILQERIALQDAA